MSKYIGSSICILLGLLYFTEAIKPPCDSFECVTEDETYWGLLYAHIANPHQFYECTPFGLELFTCPDGLVFPLCAERCEFPDSTGAPPSSTTASTRTTSEPPTEPATESPTEPATESPTEPATESPTEEPATEFPTVQPTTVSPDEWIVIQRRGAELEAGETREDFFVYWVNYTNGFGDQSKDFWLGLERISELTVSGEYELNIYMRQWSGETHTVNYDLFKVAGSSDNYRLSISGFNGALYDSMAYHNGQMFSTRDRDNDEQPYSCADSASGAWWYKACQSVNLNGLYISPIAFRSIRWYNRSGSPPWEPSVDLKMNFSEMKIRRRLLAK